MNLVSPSSTALPPTKKLRFSFLRFRLRTLMLVVTLCCFGTWGKLQYDWYCKLSLAAKWVEPLVNAPAMSPELMSSQFFGLPQQTFPAAKGIKSQQELEFLEIAITRLSQPKQRIAGLKILVESRKEQSRPLLVNLLALSRHPDTKAVLIRLIGLGREESSIPKIMPYLDDPEPRVRAAAAEALGFMHQPSYDVPVGISGWNPKLLHYLSDPPIEVSSLHGFPTTAKDFPATSKIAVPAGLRPKLETMMLSGATSEERTAAARALLAWPPESFKLRLAEWGVWIEDAGELKLVQSVLDEIPPFVHQTGNRVGSFADRVQQIMIVTKPIVHLTCDKPLVVDLEILIRHGRPWYAYPMPDDFTLDVDNQEMDVHEVPGKNEELVIELASPILSPPQESDRLQPLASLSEGYPWLLPNHRVVGSVSGWMGSGDNIVTSMGLRWQSVIVSPQKQPWMALPDVGSDPRYAWWKSLREVPSCWVTNQGETERFLYYDGPTRAHSPISTCFDGQQLTVVAQPIFDRDGRGLLTEDSGKPAVQPRAGFLIRVTDNGVIGQEFEIPGASSGMVILNTPTSGAQTSDKVATRFLQLLVKAGLTKEEAGGLIASWRKQFFETTGTRLLTILSRHDYDEMCPLNIRPVPAEIVRVGIVLAELKE